MSSKWHYIIGIVLVTFLLASCKKYLDEKPDKSLNVPATLNDLRLILDNYGIMNTAFPYSGEVLADNYYLTPADWTSLTNTTLKNYYIWQKDDQSVSEWSAAYRVAFYANVVLDKLNEMEGGRAEEREMAAGIKGAALFFRAWSFYSLAQLFAPPYDKATASQTPGIPLRLSSDFNEVSVRATVEQTYSQLSNDLKIAAALLPSLPAYSNRPSRAAAFAALARTFLAMEEYTKAFYYADSALQLHNTLIDFNDLNAAAATPFSRFNEEVLFPALSTAPLNLIPSRAKADSVLYASYDSNDLRKTVFFKKNSDNTFQFRGSYDGSNSGSVFSGVTTSEMYLVKAEALARIGQVGPAMETLNNLLQKRWRTGTFSPVAETDPVVALRKILMERRKELCFRGLRWTDLRRLNKDSRFAITLRRVLDAQTFSLPPNSAGYTLLIPKEVIDRTGMPQNP